MTVLHLAPWVDSLVDRCGHPWDDLYVEEFWVGVLGPSASWLWRKLARAVADGPATVDSDVLAASLGLSTRRGVLDRTLQRLLMFGAARWNDGVLEVRRCLPNLGARHVAEMPEPLRRAHAEAVSTTCKRVSA